MLNKYLLELVSIGCFLVVINSCKSPVANEDVYNHVRDYLPSQQFTINQDADTVLRGESGTIIRIYKGTFVDSTGQFVHGMINVSLKEAYSPSAIIMAGLTTISNGKHLMTGGMINLQASNNGNQLKIAKGKSIGIVVPTDKLDTAMRIFKGVESNGQINWIAPVPLLNSMIKIEMPELAQAKKESKRITEIDAIFEYVDTVSETSWNNEPKKNGKKRQSINSDLTASTFIQEVNERNTNNFSVDPQLSYVFEVKELGWANIDRLYSDIRSEEVNLIVELNDIEVQENIYTTLITEGCYIPGYQKMDHTYSYTHNDSEAAVLPLGASAIILFTAYKNDGSALYCIEKITISKSQHLKLKLKKVSLEQLKEILRKEL